MATNKGLVVYVVPSLGGMYLIPLNDNGPSVNTLLQSCHHHCQLGEGGDFKEPIMSDRPIISVPPFIPSVEARLPPNQSVRRTEKRPAKDFTVEPEGYNRHYQHDHQHCGYTDTLMDMSAFVKDLTTSHSPFWNLNELMMNSYENSSQASPVFSNIEGGNMNNLELVETCQSFPMALYSLQDPSCLQYQSQTKAPEWPLQTMQDSSERGFPNLFENYLYSFEISDGFSPSSSNSPTQSNMTSTNHPLNRISSNVSSLSPNSKPRSIKAAFDSVTDAEPAMLKDLYLETKDIGSYCFGTSSLSETIPMGTLPRQGFEQPSWEETWLSQWSQ